MGEGDFMPSGGHKKKYDPKHAKKIKEGGKIADKIHKKTEAHHAAEEVPAAEDQLLQDLDQMPNEVLSKKTSTKN